MKIIAIEGTDGAGKALQTSLLAGKLKDKGFSAQALSFPVYGSFFGSEIGRMLSGKAVVRADEVDAKSMALWYAMDRRAAFDTLAERTDFLLLNRYTLSNAAYQSVRADETPEAFARWVFELEHRALGLPEPDVYVLLDVSMTATAENVAKKGHRDYVGNEADVYEKQNGFLARVRNAYLRFGASLPNAVQIACMDGNALLPPDVIAKKIWDVLESGGLLT